jgi:hypothetical protein
MRARRWWRLRWSGFEPKPASKNHCLSGINPLCNRSVAGYTLYPRFLSGNILESAVYRVGIAVDISYHWTYLQIFPGKGLTDSGQWSGCSGQWTVDSGQGAVVRGQETGYVVIVRHGQEITCNSGGGNFRL